MSEILKEIRERLGDEVILLPHDLKKKEVFYNDWGRITYTDTQNPEFELQWRRKKTDGTPGAIWKRKNYADEMERILGQGGNLSVRLSGPLCAIDIDDDEEVEPFLELNPFLRGTLITKGSRGVQIWVRCLADDVHARFGLKSWPDFAPLKHRHQTEPNKHGKELKKGWGEWRCGRSGAIKSNIWGTHPSGKRYEWIVDKPAMWVRFADIRWPEHIELPWLKSEWLDMVSVFGEPWEKDEKKPKIAMPSESFWAKRFATKYYVIFEKDEERFYEYNRANGAWERRSDKEMKVRVGDDLLKVSRDPTLQAIACNGEDAPVADWRKLMIGELAAMEGNLFRSSGRLSAIVDLLKGFASRSEVFNVGNGIVHLENGMIDLKAEPLVMRPFSPKYYSRNPIPLSYRPGARCDYFLNEYLGNALPANDIDLLQRYFGLVLLGKNSVQKIMMLIGTAGGGKSTLLKILQRLIGRVNVSQVRTKHLGERFEMAKFIGKTLLCGADVKGNFLMQDGAEVLKSLSGGDFIEAELKGSNEGVDFDGEFNIIFTANSRLKVRMDFDRDAWRRRLQLILFNQPKPEKKIEHFDQWIIDREGSGILLWAMAGAKRILAGDGLELDEHQQKVVDDLLDESDSIRVFLRENVQAEKGQAIFVEDLVDSYFGYCDRVGWDAESKGSVEKKLPDMMLQLFRAKRSKSIKDSEGVCHIGYRGVSFRPEGDAEETPDVPDQEEPPEGLF